MNFTGKVAFVTGAGGGMGLKIAHDLISKGAKVLMFDIKSKPEGVSEFGDRCRYVQGDLTKDSAVAAAVKLAVTEFGGIDYLANVAGALLFGKDESALDIDLEVWELYPVSTNTAKILANLEHLLQTAWTDLKVHVTSVSDQYAAFTVAGPSARSLLDVVCMGADLSNEALPNNHFVNATICEIAVRINRMSYSGELAYEVYVASGFSHAVWETLFKAGVSFEIKPYGTESMSALRIEKGHVAGPEIDGRTTLGDLGLAGFASRVKPFSGSVLRHREKLDIAARPRLVGLEFDGNTGGLAGSLIYDQSAQQKGEEQGFLTSTTYSPALKRYIALALLREGRERHGETIEVVNHVGNTIQNAKVVSPHFFDPEGVRQNA
jgi:heterotetrameric sarcosine oxidase gamma subunit